jgi:hypothetical protein
MNWVKYVCLESECIYVCRCKNEWRYTLQPCKFLYVNEVESSTKSDKPLIGYERVILDLNVHLTFG